MPSASWRGCSTKPARFMREAMDTIARGEIRSSDFITGEVPLEGLPKVFQDMKNRNGGLKTAVIP